MKLPAAPLLASTLLCLVAVRVGAADPTVPGDFDRPANARPADAAKPAAALSPRDASGHWTPTDFTHVDPKLPTLVIAGDSTAAPGNPTHRGWGAVLADYFDPTKLNVVNRASGGRSFRTFTAEGKWRTIVDTLKPGDFVIIEFGHNDGGAPDQPPFRGDLPGVGDETREVKGRDGRLEPVRTYGAYLRQYVRDVKAKGATPIVASTTVRNEWKDGRVERGLGHMLEWARQVAHEEHVPFLDHSNLIADRYEQMGPATVAKLFPADHTHTSTDGAILNAEILISGLKSLRLEPIVAGLNERGREIAAATPRGS